MADLPKETEQRIGQLQMLEQNIQASLMQKQQFQTQLIEIESALSELTNTNRAYKIVGNIMIDSTKEALTADLTQKKEMFELRIKSLEKQEEQFKVKAKKLQEELLSEIRKKG